jgi:hypothetical protein
MGMPRVRFTVRSMMVAVAVVAIWFGLNSWMGRRAARFRALWRDHILKVGEISSPKPWPHEVQGYYHLKMAEKYRVAALRPWLLVEPDPPEPCHQARNASAPGK